MNSGGASSLSKESCSGLRDMIDCTSSDSEVSESTIFQTLLSPKMCNLSCRVAQNTILSTRKRRHQRRATADRATTPLVKGGVSVTPCLLSVPSNLLSNRSPSYDFSDTSESEDVQSIMSRSPEHDSFDKEEALSGLEGLFQPLCQDSTADRSLSVHVKGRCIPK
jgi:hypothetical protein